jgi:peptide/nickel transport system substrate-binding protein
MSKLPINLRMMLVLCALLTSGAHADTLRIGMPGLPAQRGQPYGGIYIPALWTLGASYDPLTKLRADGRLEPWLATSWAATSPTTWQFTLRPDVVFADGEPFNARAVTHAVNVLASDASAGFALARELSTLKSARVIAPLIVEIETDAPNPTLPSEVAYLLIPSPRAWRELGPEGLAATPVGTGPYLLQSWQAGRAQYTINPKAWRKPRVDKLEYIQIADGSARIQALLTGLADAIIEAPVDDTSAIEAAGGRVIALNLAGVTSIVLNTQMDSPLRDVRVRRALNMAVNRQRIVDQLLGGRTKIAFQPAPSSAEGFNPNLQPYPYDPDAAADLLVEAGYPDGFAMTMESGSGAGSINTLITQQVAADLARIKVKMNVRPVLLSQLLQRVQQGGWEGSAFNFSFFTPTLDALRPMRNQSCLWVKPWYCDQVAIPDIVQAQAEFDPTKRRALLNQIMARSHDQAQAIFIYEGVGFMGLGPRVKELPSDFGFIRFDEVRLKN